MKPGRGLAVATDDGGDHGWPVPKPAGRHVTTLVAALALLVGAAGGGCRGGDYAVTALAPEEIPETITGRPRVRDGDSLDFPQVRVRLFGVDAFELEQRCKLPDGREYPCGHAAKHALEHMVRGQIVTCYRRDVDSYGRMVAVCRVGADTDLGAEQVRTGLALAYRHYSKAYAPFEWDARRNRRGAWDGTFDKPWEWRHSR
jgi:endonuclease YncB( thermonuclease family)